MSNEEVISIIEETMNKVLDMLRAKGRFYGTNDDRLALLKAVGSATDMSALRATHTLVSKHFTALPSMFDNIDNFTEKEFDEYFLDIIVYTCFMRCLVKEHQQDNAL